MKLYKMGAVLILSASFGLLACGDDSSSGAFDSGKGDEASIQERAELTEKIEQLSDKMSKMTEDRAKAQKEFGTCDEDNEDATETATIAGKKYTFTCDGYNWECEEFGEDLEKIVEDMQELSTELASLNKKDSDSKASGCNFKKTDKTWTYSYTRDSYGESISTTITVKINGDEYTEKIKSVTSGQSVAMACSLAAKEMEESGGYCDGDTFVIEETNTDDIDNDEDLQELFDSHMESCQIANGNYDWEPESNKDDEDVDKPSKDEDSDEPVVKPSKDEKDDSDSDEPVVTPAKDEKDDEGSDDDFDDIYQDIIDNPEKYGMSEEEAKEYQEAMKEIEDASKAMDDMGECTADREGEKFSVTLYGQDMHYICKDEEWDIDYSAYGLDEEAFVED